MIKNFYTANTAEPGDVFLVTVKAVVQYDGSYRLYRCPYLNDDIPQGDRLFEGRFYTCPDNDNKESLGIEITAEQLFPILRAAKGPDLS